MKLNMLLTCLILMKIIWKLSVLFFQRIGLMIYLANLREFKQCSFIKHVVSWKQNYLIVSKTGRAIYEGYEIITKMIRAKLLLFIC